MGIADNTAMRLSYKAHTSSAIIPGTEPTFSSDPGASSAQQLRRVSSSLALGKSTFRANEITTHRQIADFRHGRKLVTGEISGEFSPLTYQDPIAAVLRASWTATISKNQTQFTSVAATAASSKFTVGGSTWAAQGFMVGHVIRFSTFDGSVNAKNFLITALNGVDATVSPAPAGDLAADTNFTVTTVGRHIFPPESSLVASKWAFEHYYEDEDLTLLFTEARIGSAKISMPAEGIPTISFGIMARNMTPYDAGGQSPFFTSPTAPTSTNLLSTIGGKLLVGGTLQGVITGFELNLNLNPSASAVAFTSLVPEIYLGLLDVSGQITAMFTDNTMVNYFINETEVEIILMLTDSSAVDANFVTITLPRVKLGGAGMTNAGEAGIPITLPFQALKKATATGYPAATILIQDSQGA